jgi:hypothetical protein
MMDAAQLNWLGETWVNYVIVGLVVLFILSRFVKFKLPHDHGMGRKGKKGNSFFGKLHLDDLKMPEMVTPKDVTDDKDGKKPAERRVVMWDPERIKLGKGLEGAAKIAAIDPTFDEKAFMKAMRELFVRYMDVTHHKNEQALELMGSPVFVRRVLQVWESKAWEPVALEELKEVSILSARTAGRTAIFELKFVADVRRGDAKHAVLHPLDQRWVVARPFQSEDPQWEIQSITTGADA